MTNQCQVQDYIYFLILIKVNHSLDKHLDLCSSQNAVSFDHFNKVLKSENFNIFPGQKNPFSNTYSTQNLY